MIEPPRQVRPGDLLRGLARARRTLPLYGAAHPVAAQTIEEAHRVVVRLMVGRPSLKVFVHEDTFYMGKTALLEESLRFSHLVADLRDHDIGVIELLPELEPWELRTFVEILNTRPPDLAALGGAGAELKKRGVQHVAVGKAPPMLPEEQAELRVDPQDVYRAGLRVADDLYYQASRDLPLDLRKTSMVVNSLIDVLTTDRLALQGMAALKNYDEDTCHHSVNVSILCLMIGQHLQLKRPLMVALGVSAMLHDVGKVRVPREILNKNGGLSPEEQETVRRHTLYGAHILRNVPGLARLSMVVAFEHHANYNLSGYPRITAKRAPHLLTRLVHVADFFDASTSSRRVYQRPMLPSEAMKFILNGAGKIFDPMLARVFVQVLGLYPIGSVVELNTGELAIVHRVGEREAARPEVKIVTDRFREALAPRLVNLEEDRERQVIREVDAADVDLDVANLLAGTPAHREDG
jgi:HD-GYP domain-containing protein (c-di-GMP phosphodiesterase class II)